MLLSQNCCGAQHHHLAARIHTLEGRTQRHLGLAKAHVAAEQAIHRLCRLHISLNVGNGIELVVRRLVGEALLHLNLLRRIGRACNTRYRRAASIQIHQVKGEFLGTLARLSGSTTPVRRVQTREARLAAVWSHVARNAIHLLEWHVEFVAVGVLQQEVVALAAAYLLAHNLGKQSNAVRSVHHVVARLKGEGDLGDIHAAARTPALGIHARVKVGKREYCQVSLGNYGALSNRRVNKGHAATGKSGHRNRSARDQVTRIECISCAMRDSRFRLCSSYTRGAVSTTSRSTPPFTRSQTLPRTSGSYVHGCKRIHVARVLGRRS